MWHSGDLGDVCISCLNLVHEHCETEESCADSIIGLSYPSKAPISRITEFALRRVLLTLIAGPHKQQ
jgi:hypothetical protein